jgi:hypothetical protein
MAIFRLKNLFLSSLFILFTSCAVPLKYKLIEERTILPSDITPLISSDNAMLYKMQIFLFNKYYSGLLLHKQTDAATSHVVFVTELGMKMFDMQVKSDSLKMVYCFGPMNQPKITTLLENDMGSILLNQLLNRTGKVYSSTKGQNKLYVTKQGKARNIYYTQENSNKIIKSIARGKLFTKQKTVYKYGSDNILESVSLKHKGLLRLRIKLNRINKEKAND